jgi:hypothetical protein
MTSERLFTILMRIPSKRPKQSTALWIALAFRGVPSSLSSLSSRIFPSPLSLSHLPSIPSLYMLPFISFLSMEFFICSSSLFFMVVLHGCSSWLFFMVVLHGCSSSLFFILVLHRCSSSLFFIVVLHPCSSSLFFHNGCSLHRQEHQGVCSRHRTRRVTLSLRQYDERSLLRCWCHEGGSVVTISCGMGRFIKNKPTPFARFL